MRTAVSFQKVSFAYEDRSPLLNEVDLAAAFGELTLIAGHSGSGKSSLLYLASGIIPHLRSGKFTGKILIEGEDIKDWSQGAISRKVGVVLQNADEQIVHRKVADEIAFGCENLAFSPERIEQQIAAACHLLKLDPDSLTRSLSGGQKQRLITASILAMQPKIIILDEPLANLDRSGAELLLTALRQLAKAGYCIIVVEHRLDLVLPFADRIYHLDGGGLKEISDRASFLKEQSEVIEDILIPYQEQKPLFFLKDIEYAIRGRKILRGVNGVIKKGERVLLLGENGCGKTTLLRLLSRLARPTAGSIEQEIDSRFRRSTTGSKRWYKKVGVVYQNPDYQLFMPTVRQEIFFNSASRDYAEDIAKLFDVYDLFDRHPQSLSEGQKRRVTIAAVAAGKPEILLLDEPTVGQDYQRLKEMVQILNRLHHETGNTMITVTHDKRCASALCDRALLIADGCIAREGGKELVEAYFFADKAEVEC